MPADPEVRWAGDSAFTVRLGDCVDAAVHERTLALTHAIEACAIPAVREVVPAYASVSVYFDPLLRSGDDLVTEVLNLLRLDSPHATAKSRLIEIPVCYGGTYGPDLEEVARLSGFSPTEVIAQHQAVTYHVYLIGFLPGFPYLGSIPAALRVPRLSEPRRKVSAGSVAIAGEQCGIYPLDSPGGWRILGRTPLRMFDPGRAHPSLLAAGDEVRFVPIDSQAFERLAPHATD